MMLRSSFVVLAIEHVADSGHLFLPSRQPHNYGINVVTGGEYSLCWLENIWDAIVHHEGFSISKKGSMGWETIWFVLVWTAHG